MWNYWYILGELFKLLSTMTMKIYKLKMIIRTIWMYYSSLIFFYRYSWYILYNRINVLYGVNGSRNFCFFQICQCCTCTRTIFMTLLKRTNYGIWRNCGRWRCIKIRCAEPRVIGAQLSIFCQIYGNWTMWWWCARNVNKKEKHLTRMSACA